jgi:hypothetical protein
LAITNLLTGAGKGGRLTSDAKLRLQINPLTRCGKSLGLASPTAQGALELPHERASPAALP